MKRFQLMASLALLPCLGASVAWAQQQPQAAAGQVANKQQDVDRQFLQESIRTNLFEVAVGKDVAERAQDANVKQFAQMMAQYHAQANDRLQQVAQQMDIEVPTQMNQWQQAMVQHMQQLQPGELERKYIFHQAGAHQIKMLNHQMAINKASQPQVKQLAQQMVPDLRDHMQQAQRLATQIAGGPAMRGAPTGPQGAADGQVPQQQRPATGAPAAR